MEPTTATIEDVVAGRADVASVPLTQAVEAAETLAGSGVLDVLRQHVERVLPRLVKKERFDEIEAIWLTCCTAEVLPREAMVHTAERLAARGQGARAGDLMTMLAEALVETGHAEDGLAVVATGLAWSSSPRYVAEARRALSALYPGAPNLEAVLARLDRAASSQELGDEILAASRALLAHPGTYLQWSDWSIAQVVTTDGREALVRHPSGLTETRSVAGDPPPKVLGSDAHEVRRLFQPEQLRADWSRDPVEPLHKLLLEHQGVVSATSLKGIVVPRIVSEAEFDGVLERLRESCSQGLPDIPSYESKRRLFIAPGFEAPRPQRRAPRAAEPDEDQDWPEARPARAAATRAPAAGPTTITVAKWIDLTTRPEIRRLISRIEDEVASLTREMNVDLPRKLEEARAHGDLRENAEYDAAKERLRLVQARIEQLHGRLAKIRELARVRLVPGRITTMSTIVVADEETGAERTLRLVPPELPDPSPGDVSIGTPYARALLGKTAGEMAVVKLPRRTERLEVVAVIDPVEE
jgi:transcription elongation factor GreA